MADGWTVAEACRDFAEAGIAVDPARLRGIIRHLPGFQRAGEVRKPPGSKGGRGDPLYPIGELQHLVTALKPWLTPPASGDT